MNRNHAFQVGYFSLYSMSRSRQITSEGNHAGQKQGTVAPQIGLSPLKNFEIITRKGILFNPIDFFFLKLAEKFYAFPEFSLKAKNVLRISSRLFKVS